MSEYKNADEAIENILKKDVLTALNEALDWRSDDFGHDCTKLLEAVYGNKIRFEGVW